jgi:4-amino-4-deoxy-L-arabinose transferase-like glycosyltransferase
MQKLSLVEKIVGISLILIWCSHLIGVFTPEVGFDAVWYHLPIVDRIFSEGRLVYIPQLYQSLNPLFSDLMFGVGYKLGGELGAKVVAYLFGISLVAASYFLAKEYLSRQWALIVVLMISTFQVVAWQSSSFYVDVAKAFWEIGCLLALVRWRKTNQQRYLLAAGFLFSASLGTKLFSLLLLPCILFIVVYLARQKKLNMVCWMCMLAWVIPLPYYMFSYKVMGTPWYSFNHHLGKIGEIGQDQTVLFHLWRRTLQLPQFFRSLMLARDYTSISLVILLPLVGLFWKELSKDKLLKMLVLWTVVQMGLWWYLPPLSTRYVLSGFVTWAILVGWAAEKYTGSRRNATVAIYIVVALAVLVNMMPRVWVNYRSLRYIFGTETKNEYIHQFFDGNIDQHLQRWHGVT